MGADPGQTARSDVDPGERPLPFHLAIDFPEVHRVIELVALELAMRSNIHVVNDEQFLVDAGRLHHAQTGWRPDTRATPEPGAADRMTPDGIARNDPDLMRRRRGCHHQVPQNPVVGIRFHVHSRIIAPCHGPPGSQLNDGVHLVDRHVLGDQLAEQDVVTGGEAEPAHLRVNHEAIVPAGFRIGFLDPRQEGLVVGLAKIPVIQIDPFPNPTTEFADVVFPAAISGVEAEGNVYRMDNIPIRLRKLIDSEYPEDEAILKRILDEVRAIKEKEGN